MCQKKIRAKKIAELMLTVIESDSLQKEMWEFVYFDPQKHIKSLEELCNVPQIIRGSKESLNRGRREIGSYTDAINVALKKSYIARIEEEISQALLERAGKAVIKMFGETTILDIKKVELKMGYPKIVGCCADGRMVLQLQEDEDIN